ncbi:MAG: PEGA domain-containing protein [Kofleriaceae bacterium]
MRVVVLLCVMGLASVAAAAPAATDCLAARKGKTTVKIDSSPPGATIFLGDKACGIVGTTPWTGKLAPGPVIVMIERQSYLPVTQTLTVTAKPNLLVMNIALARTNIGTVDIRADADPNITGAQVLIDDVAKGSAPIVLQVPGGRRKLELKKPGFDPFVQYLDVVDSGSQSLLPVLVPTVIAKYKLVIEADVVGAEVWIAGTQRGVTPLLAELAAGTYELELRTATTKPWKQTVVMQSDQVVRVKLVAAGPPASAGTLRITSPIAGEVSIDGAVAGKTPFETKLAAGEYWVVVRASGYKPFERRVTITAAAKTELIATAVRIAEVRVESMPAGSSVFVDGTRAGATPITLQLELGEHRIFIERPGYQRHEEKVKLVVGAPMITILARLQP